MGRYVSLWRAILDLELSSTQINIRKYLEVTQHKQYGAMLDGEPTQTFQLQSLLVQMQYSLFFERVIWIMTSHCLVSSSIVDWLWLFNNSDYISGTDSLLVTKNNNQTYNAATIYLLIL
jgi:hypothetical protein